MKVLIADDDLLARTILKDQLVANGCEVVEAANGTEAVDAFDKEQPDAVFVDLLMPRMNGLDVIRAMRERQPHLPAYLLTALSHGTVKQFGEERHVATAVLEKPFQARQLERILQGLRA
ncbi:MAG: response regulator [Myxococcales bacterium]